MISDIRNQIRVVRWGIVLSISAILMGFVLGGVFGAAEESVQNWLQAQGQSVLETIYANDASKLEATLRKAFTYLKRAHMHAGGIGTATLSLSLLLSLLNAPAILRRLCALALGIGALGYPLFWLLAGLRMPVLGSGTAAKESLEWLAVPSAGLLLLGVLGSLILTGWSLWRREKL